MGKKNKNEVFIFCFNVSTEFVYAYGVVYFLLLYWCNNFIRV